MDRFYVQLAGLDSLANTRLLAIADSMSDGSVRATVDTGGMLTDLMPVLLPGPSSQQPRRKEVEEEASYGERSITRRTGRR